MIATGEQCCSCRSTEGGGVKTGERQSAFGKALASLPTLTQHQAAVAERLCRRYGGQLRGRVSLANEDVALAA